MNKNSGFTLIEVLIAMLVLAVGLLGLAGLQASSLKNNQSAYNRGQATQLAYDLADRMRANTAAAATYIAIAPLEASEVANCLSVNGCSNVQMAENDLYEWNAELTATLPGGEGHISSNGAAPDPIIYTINIEWDDDRDGDPDNNPNFQTSFQL